MWKLLVILIIIKLFAQVDIFKKIRCVHPFNRVNNGVKFDY